MQVSFDPYANIRARITAPVQTMRTFQIDQPLETHFRVAHCREVDCDKYADGWKMGFDLTDPERVKAAKWVRDTSGRTYTAELLEAGAKVVFTFPAGQRCFEKHHVPLEREPFYVVRRGDWRGNPDGRRAVQRHRNADDFLDHWQSDLGQLTDIRERG